MTIDRGTEDQGDDIYHALRICRAPIRIEGDDYASSFNRWSEGLWLVFVAAGLHQLR